MTEREPDFCPECDRRLFDGPCQWCSADQDGQEDDEEDQYEIRLPY